MIHVKFKKLNENAVVPVKLHEYDGARDLIATEIVQMEENLYAVKVGFALEFSPNNTRFRVVPRSSLTKTNWILQNTPCLGDNSYRGEYEFRFRGLPIGVDPQNYKLVYDEFPFKVGDRFAQCYFEIIEEEVWVEYEELSETTRGAGGYGSTGN